VIGYREWPCDAGTAADVAAALAQIDGEVVVLDYNRNRIAAVELRETAEGFEVRFRFARRPHRVAYGSGRRW
jgi:hypothetical protein